MSSAAREITPQLLLPHRTAVRQVVYHFMFAPSFWADTFERNVVHCRHRDVKLIAASRAPLSKLQAFATRMGWTFD